MFPLDFVQRLQNSFVRFSTMNDVNYNKDIFTSTKEFFNTADYVLGNFDFSVNKNIAVDGLPDDVILEVGAKYKVVYGCEKWAAITYPSPIITDNQGNKIKIIKIFSTGKEAIVEFEVVEVGDYPEIQQAGGVLGKVIILAIAGAFVAYFGYMTFKGLYKIVVQPSVSILLVAIAIYLMFNTYTNFKYAS